MVHRNGQPGERPHHAIEAAACGVEQARASASAIDTPQAEGAISAHDVHRAYAALEALEAAVAQCEEVDAGVLTGRADVTLVERVASVAADIAASVDTRRLSDRGLCDHAVALDREATRLQAAVASLVSAVDRRQAYRIDGCVTAGSWWRHATRRDNAAATRFARTARRLRWLPELRGALADGEVTFDHAQAVCTAAIPQRRPAICDAEHALVQLARRGLPRDVRRACRRIADTVDPDGADSGHSCDDGSGGGADVRRELYMSRTIDGLWDLRGLLDPVTGERLHNLLDVTTEADAQDTPAHRRRSPAQRRHDGLDTIVKAAEEHPDLPSAHGATPHVLLTVDLMALLGADDAASRRTHLASGTPLSGDRVAELLAAGKISAVAMWGPWRTIGFGRTRRVLPNWLRPVLHAIHGTCRGPGCDRPAAWTEAAHVKAWATGGTTTLDQTFPACRAHNLLMEAGWTVDYDPQTAVCTWTSPDGHTTIRTHPPPP